MTTVAPLLQDASLIWGVLGIVGPGESDDSNPFTIEAIAGGTHFGNPVPIVEAIHSLVTDWALTETVGWEVREVPIRLRVSANDGESHAQAEAALSQQRLLTIPPPLVWISPIGLSEPCVFDVIDAHLEADTDEGWDLKEKNSGHRHFLLTLTCLPFVRAADSTIVPALPAPPIDPGDPATITEIDDCSSLTPGGTYAGTWTLETNGGSPTGPTVLVDGAESYIEYSAVISSDTQHLRGVRSFTTPLAVAADEYIVFEMANEPGPNQGRMRAAFNGAYRDPVAVYSEPSSLLIRYWFTAPAAVNQLKILKDFDYVPGIDTETHRILSVAVTDTVGDITTSTTRQRTRQLQVAGTAPTQAALRLFDSTAQPLGDDILVYTSTNTDWQPPLRPWLDSSGVVNEDTSLISGGFHNLSVPSVYLIPARLFTPGPYALLARLATTGAQTLTWEAKIVDTAGADTIGSSQVQTGEVLLPDTSGAYTITRLGWVMLPPVEVETDDYMVKLTLTGVAAIEVDEAWPFALHDGALTWVRTGGIPLHWIEIRSPELGSARPSVWGGTGAVGELAACINFMCSGSFGSHQFAPGSMLTQTITDNAWKSECEMEYFRRFLFHVWAGQEDSG